MLSEEEQHPPRPTRFGRLRNWYGKYERPISSLSLIGGFVFDAVALPRVDELWENFWIVGHIVIVALFIILVNAKENKGGEEADPGKAHFWYVNILQFFFGGILSAFLVFYFRSGTIASSWPFYLILAAAFIANESLKRHYTRLVFQISLLFLSIYSFAIYFAPILLHALGPWVFALSGAASLVILWFYLRILNFFAHERKGRIWLALAIAALFIGINILYYFNFIPPLPLSLKDTGAYQSLTVNAPGQYTVQYEDQGFFAFFNFYDTIHLTAGAPLYAYSAVFSPASLNADIVHEWQYYNDATGSWVTRGKIPLSVIGGRDGGYRTFSEEENLTPGKWRVNVETTRGQVIGSLRFNVIIADMPPTLLVKQIN